MLNIRSQKSTIRSDLWVSRDTKDDFMDRHEIGKNCYTKLCNVSKVYI